MSKQTTVLIIDDDPHISEVTEMILVEEGFRVLTDLRGDYFQQESPEIPDVVLLDLLITGSSGEHVARTIRSQPKTAHLPIIILSAQTSDELVKAVGICEANAYVNKPYDIDDLINTINSLVSDQTNERSAPAF